MAAEASATLAEGRYRLIEVIGSGGMATVYRAFDARLQVARAIKVLLPALANRERLRARFEAEARTMALLEHRNIVRVYDVGSDGNRVYIVMELVEGGSLVDRLEAHGPLPARQAVDVCMHVLAGLSVAHARGIIHRDIKPHNVLLTSEGEVRVTDFGIARLAQSDDNLTKTGAVMGTWGFMAPEQRANSKGVDARADLYSVAATLFSCVTNETPMDLFAAELDANMLARVPAALAAVIGRATRYDREERYADTAEMAAALSEVRDALPAIPPGSPPLLCPPAWASAPVPAPRRPLVDAGQAPADARPASPEVARSPATADPSAVPTMVPDRTPPPLVDERAPRDNLTFDALAGDGSLDALEARAEAAARPALAPQAAPAAPAVTKPIPRRTASPARRATPAAPDAAPRRGRPAALGAAAGIAALALVGGGWWWLGPDAPLPADPTPDAAPPSGEPPVPEPVALPPAPAPDPAPVVPDPTAAAPAAPDPPPAAAPVEPAAQPGRVRGQGSRRVVTPPPAIAAPAPAPAPAAAPAAPGDAPPRLVHTPVGSASIGSPVAFSAEIDRGRYSVTLYFRPAASGAAYRAKVMVQNGSSYQASLTPDESFASGIEYHIKAVAEEPGLENLAAGSGFRPYRVELR